MSFRTFKHIQDIEQIIKNTVNITETVQTKNAKLSHIGQKVSKIKKQIETLCADHKKEIKEKTKDINKLKKNKQEMNTKMAEQMNKCKQIKKKNKSTHWKYYDDTIDQQTPNQYDSKSPLIQKQNCQSKIKSLQLDNESLKNKILQLQQQNSKLKEQLENLQILLNQFVLQEIYDQPSLKNKSSVSEVSDQEKCQMIAKKQKKNDFRPINQKISEKEQQQQDNLKHNQDIETEDQYEYQIQVFLLQETNQHIISSVVQSKNNSSHQNQQIINIKHNQQNNSQENPQIELPKNLTDNSEKPPTPAPPIEYIVTDKSNQDKKEINEVKQKDEYEQPDTGTHIQNDNTMKQSNETTTINTEIVNQSHEQENQCKQKNTPVRLKTKVITVNWWHHWWSNLWK